MESFLKKILGFISPFDVSKLQDVRTTILQEMKDKTFDYYLEKMKKINEEIDLIIGDDEKIIDDDYWEKHGQEETFWQKESPELNSIYKTQKLKRLGLVEPSGVTSLGSIFLTDKAVKKLVGEAEWMTAQQLILFRTIMSLYFKNNIKLWPVHLNMDLSFIKTQDKVKSSLFNNSNNNNNNNTNNKNDDETDSRSSRVIVVDKVKLLFKSMLAGSGPFILKILQQINSNNNNTVKDMKVADLTSDIFSNVPGLTESERDFVVSNFAIDSSYIDDMNPKMLGSASIAEAHVTFSKEHNTKAVMKFVKPMYAYYFLCEINFILTDIWKNLTRFADNNTTHILQCRKLLMFLVREFSKEFDYEGEFNNTVIGYEIYNEPMGPIKSMVAIEVKVNPFPVLIMEYVEGKALDKILNNPKTSKEEYVVLYNNILILFSLWMKRTLWGKAGFFHSDLHPGNIIVDQKGDFNIIDYGSCGMLTKRQQCVMITAMMVSGQFQHLTTYELKTTKGQRIHEKNLKVSKKFVQLIWQICEVHGYKKTHLDDVAEKILIYGRLNFVQLFLEIVEISDNIGECTNNPVLLFGRGVAYVGNLLDSIIKKCNNQELCPDFKIKDLIKSALLKHPTQLISFFAKGRVC